MPNTIHISNCVNMDASFKPAAKGGITVGAKAKNPKITYVLVKKNGLDATSLFKIIF